MSERHNIPDSEPSDEDKAELTQFFIKGECDCPSSGIEGSIDLVVGLNEQERAALPEDIFEAMQELGAWAVLEPVDGEERRLNT